MMHFYSTAVRGFVLVALAHLALAAASPERLHRIDPQTPEGLRQLFAPTGEPLPFLSAHRGGAREAFPENCLATFIDTLRYAFAAMEVDPRYTKDGAIVLHHDATLERTTTGRGRVIDHTLAELRQLKLKDLKGKVTDFGIPTLDEALEWARGRTLLVLDQKDVPAIERARIVTRHKAEAYALLIVGNFKDAQACHALNANLMMEVMIPNLEKAGQFGRLGIPWRNVVAFVGHIPPEDPALYEFIHRQGAACMIGTSRNLDRKILTGQVAEIKALEADYRAFLRRGADLIETDIPTLVGPLLFGNRPPPAGKRAFLVAP
jgi:glycerophosphoryl diester phosphodiesterase